MRFRSTLVVTAVALVLVAPAESANPQIAGLQVALRAYGFYLGPIDGVSGQGTATAVRAFQRSSRLAVDGVPGATTRRALGRLGKPLYGKRTLVQGRVGLDVSVLQYLLARYGVGRVIDGYFGEETDLAVRRFQRLANLAIDGIAGPATLRALGGASRSTRLPERRYVVRAGDSLTAIAERHGTSLRSLASTNRLDPARPLLIGTRLRIPRVAAAPLAAPPSSVRATITATATQYGVDPSLARALAWMESGFQPHVVSSAGALGVMQVTPPTWDFVETVLLGTTVPRTTAGNIRIGVVFLRHLLREFRGDERLALAAYYQGAKAVREHGLYDETRTYVEAIRSLRGRV
ncbi:MAG: peptidoglycan-binding protein [Gaiellaceae bacterium MAG52_C11]|nr:peptidoglycan-binding protein [Candidatus Gaiellasilicea maunaloa]